MSVIRKSIYHVFSAKKACIRVLHLPILTQIRSLIFDWMLQKKRSTCHRISLFNTCGCCEVNLFEHWWRIPLSPADDVAELNSRGACFGTDYARILFTQCVFMCSGPVLPSDDFKHASGHRRDVGHRVVPSGSTESMGPTYFSRVFYSGHVPDLFLVPFAWLFAAARLASCFSGSDKAVIFVYPLLLCVELQNTEDCADTFRDY